MQHMRDRLQAFGIHFLLSLLVAALAALLVFGLWFPYPYREISGGRELFLLIVGVDIVIGPLITLAIFNRSKPGHMRLIQRARAGVDGDFFKIESAIGILQLHIIQIDGLQPVLQALNRAF